MSVEEIFERFGGPAVVAKVVGVKVEHAAAMRRRGSIPSGYWFAMVEYAASNGIAVTYEDFAKAHARPVAAE